MPFDAIAQYGDLLFSNLSSQPQLGIPLPYAGFTGTVRLLRLAVRRDRLTLPANDAGVEFIEAMTEPEAADQTIEKLVGVYRVLIPHKIAAYTYHRNNTSQITDAPTIRSLEFALQDELDDWRDGEMMLQSLIETEDELQRAIDHQAKLQRLLLAAGGIAGPGTATVNVTVTNVNDDPVANDDSATVVEDSGANAIDVLANDTDADGGPRAIGSVTQPTNGTVVITGGGAIGTCWMTGGGITLVRTIGGGVTTGGGSIG